LSNFCQRTLTLTLHDSQPFKVAHFHHHHHHTILDSRVTCASRIPATSIPPQSSKHRSHRESNIINIPSASVISVANPSFADSPWIADSLTKPNKTCIFGYTSLPLPFPIRHSCSSLRCAPRVYPDSRRPPLHLTSFPVPALNLPLHKTAGAVGGGRWLKIFPTEPFCSMPSMHTIDCGLQGSLQPVDLYKHGKLLPRMTWPIRLSPSLGNIAVWS
jgi:hypothetical protein